VDNRLSAHLAEETKNDTYTRAAFFSAKFLRNILTDSTNALVYRGVRLHDCTFSLGMEQADSGHAIHAWSVLSTVTGDDVWRDA
jgi:hypothetical protein